MRVVYSIGVELSSGALAEVGLNAIHAIEKKGMLKSAFFLHGAKDADSGLVRENYARINLPAFVLHRYWAKDNLFDISVAMKMPSCEIFHGWNGFSLFSIMAAKRKNAKTIVERASTHILTQKKILETERMLFGLSGSGLNPISVRKSLLEYKHAHYVFVPSDLAYNSFVENGFERERLIKIPLGVDLGVFSPAKKESDVFTVLFVGSIILRKGLQYLLQAYSKMDKKGKELVVIGSVSPEMRRIFNLYMQKMKFKHIEWADNLLPYYRNASVFVLPTLEEGFSLALLKAMACGIPVITTENSGLPIRDGVEGFICPFRDPKSIREKLLYLFENESERKRMGNMARRKAEDFSWDKYGENLIKVYRSLCE
ncbi:MAG: glycosyltransferase family 4 protein [Candidatus Micrarchaeia archaeon]